MKSDIRFVFDTNVVISALLLKQSVSRRAFDKARRMGRLLISEITIEELDRVLKRQKFKKYVTEEERMEFITAFVREGHLIDITERVNVCRDPDDNKFLELALSGGATYIISGDKDLLALHPFRGIAVLTPAQFLKVFPGDE